MFGKCLTALFHVGDADVDAKAGAIVLAEILLAQVRKPQTQK